MATISILVIIVICLLLILSLVKMVYIDSIAESQCPKQKVHGTKIITKANFYGTALQSQECYVKFKLYGLWWYIRIYNRDGDSKVRLFQNFDEAQKHIATFTANKLLQVA